MKLDRVQRFLLFLWVFGTLNPAMASVLKVPHQYPDIQGAINAAADGDEVSVQPGLYSENIDFHDKQLLLRSVLGPAVTTIRGHTGVVVPQFAVVMGHGATLEGFTIANMASSPGGVKVAGNFTNGFARVIGNVFDGTAQALSNSSALDFNDTDGLVERNSFEGYRCNDNFGHTAVLTAVGAADLIVRNNLFFDCDCTAVSVGGSSTLTSVFNNTITGSFRGIYIDHGGPPIVYANNLLAGNQIGVEVNDNGPPSPIWIHNLVFGNTADYVVLANQTGLNGNVSVEPDLLPNFRLSNGSPAIDAGTTPGAPGNDFDGFPRPTDGNGDGLALHDIGAFEYQPRIVEVPTLSPLLGFIYVAVLLVVAMGAIRRDRFGARRRVGPF